jgi:parvulin-like peptidyl-prolyl isomerase
MSLFGEFMKQNIMLPFFVLTFFLTHSASSTSAHSSEPLCSIVGIVDREAITHQDVLNRLRLILISSGQEVTAELVAQFYPQVLENLIDEAIQCQIAEKMKVSVSKEDVDKRIAAVEKQNGMRAGSLKAFLLANTIPLQTMVNQIRATLLWTRYIEAKYGHAVHISPKDIQRLKDKIFVEQSQPSYHVAEIVLYDRGQGSNVKKQAEHIRQLIDQGVSFGKLAQQFSQSPSKDGGGNLGFQNLDRFDTELQELIKKTSVPNIIGPVALPSRQYPHKWVILALVGYQPCSPNPYKPTDDQIFSMLHSEALSLYSRKELEKMRKTIHHEVRSKSPFSRKG